SLTCMTPWRQTGPRTVREAIADPNRFLRDPSELPHGRPMPTAETNVADPELALLQPALASVLAQRDRERRRLQPCFQLCDPLVLARGLAVHGILQSLHQPLQVSNPGFSRVAGAGVRIVHLGSRFGGGCRGYATNVSDARDEPLPLAHAHDLPYRLGRAGRGGYRRRSASVILRITSEPLSTCSRTSSSLAWRFSCSRSHSVFTSSPSRRRRGGNHKEDSPRRQAEPHG